MKRVIIGLTTVIFLFLIVSVKAESYGSIGSIYIEKLVSVDGGTTWKDADTPDSAATIPVGQGAIYKLVVNNNGDVPLTDVHVNDPDLGIVNYAVQNLAPGETAIIDNLPQLNQPNRCPTPGEYQNIASAWAEAQTEPTSGVFDSDPAWVKCIDLLIPCIDIEKYVSVDGGITWIDADTLDNAATTPVGQGAVYKFVITNCGNVLLTDVHINDFDLGIINYPVQNLAAGVALTIDYLSQLNQPNRCLEAGEFQNVASVWAEAQTVPPSAITDSDPAWVICTHHGCTPGYWKNHLDSWTPTGYSPNSDFDTTFGVDFFDPDITLEQAVWARGGGVNRLARHGAAALLSAAHQDVNYPLTVAEVIAIVQAGDADTLVRFNELYCPLD